MQDIPVILPSCLPKHKNTQSVKTNIFPDSGANICLAGPQHIAHLDLDVTDLIPCNIQVSAKAGSKLNCLYRMAAHHLLIRKYYHPTVIIYQEQS